MQHADNESKSIDFSDLNIERNFSSSNLSTNQIIVITVLAVVAILVLAKISIELLLAALIVGSVAVAILWILAESRFSQQKVSALAAFANKNGFAYSESSNDSWGPGSLFTHGHSKSMRDVVSGSLYDLPFRLYTYAYNKGSGKNERTYDVTVMEFTLPRKLPHMVIDSLVEPGNYSLSTLPIQFDSSQRIDLEGDFHEYFALYTPDTYGVTALSILAPDVMEAIMRYASLCDIEIIDNKLYFYWPNIEVGTKEFEDKFSTTQAILDEIGKKLTRGDVFGKPSQARVHSSPGKGVRLKEFRWQPIILLLVILYFAQSFVSTFYPATPDILGWAFWGILACIGWKYHRRTQLKKNLAKRFERAAYASK